MTLPGPAGRDGPGGGAGGSGRAAAPAGLRLTVVGCAGSFASPSSAASCYLVEAPGPDGTVSRVVLDLGNGALGPLQQYLDPRSLDAVLLSHLHPDHCHDLAGLYVMRRYHPDGRAWPRLPVYGPEGTSGRLEAAYRAMGPWVGPDAGSEGPGPDVGSEGPLSSEFDVRSWREGEAVRVGALLVVPFAVWHPVPAYGMRVSWSAPTGGEVVLGYSGDTDECPGLARVAAGVDLLLAEAAFVEGRDDASRGIHLTGRRAGQAAATGGAGRLVLTHVPSWNDPTVAPAEAAAVYDGPIETAAPGRTWLLGR